MHELSLATEIIELVKPSIPEGESLKAVGLTVGLLAGVCTDSLEFCFTELARIEGFAGAKLVMTEVPAKYRCLACEHTYETNRVETLCPSCDSMNRTMLGGTEFSVDFIEV